VSADLPGDYTPESSRQRQATQGVGDAFSAGSPRHLVEVECDEDEEY